MTSKNDVLSGAYFLTYFCQRSGCSTSLPTPPPPLPLGVTAITDHPRVGEVLPGRGLQSGIAPVIIPSVSGPGCGECGGGGFTGRPGLSFFLSGPLAPHWSGDVPETGRLYGAVTHHTCSSLRGPGSFNLDLISLPQLVSKWGLVLPHLVCDMPRGSRFI
jgi:hypothetical protein